MGESTRRCIATRQHITITGKRSQNIIGQSWVCGDLVHSLHNFLNIYEISKVCMRHRFNGCSPFYDPAESFTGRRKFTNILAAVKMEPESPRIFGLRFRYGTPNHFQMARASMRNGHSSLTVVCIEKCTPSVLSAAVREMLVRWNSCVHYVWFLCFTSPPGRAGRRRRGRLLRSG
jgi:hypothetical protein